MAGTTVDHTAPRNYWPHYNPTASGAGVAAALFIIAILIHLNHMFRKKPWIWSIMIIGCVMEVIGYFARVASTTDHYSRPLFVVQYLMIFLAPVPMAGVIYIVFGRIVFRVVPPHMRTFQFLWVPARWLTPIFVTGDVISLIFQAAGGVLITTTDRTSENAQQKLDRGKTIALIGVTVQIIAFAFFIVVAGKFHFASRQFELALDSEMTTCSKCGNRKDHNTKYLPTWRHMLYAVNISSAFIMIRSVYREIEYAMGKDTYLDAHEWPVYVLDVGPMLMAAFVFTYYPPGDYVPLGFRQPKDLGKSLSDNSDVEGYLMNNRSGQYDAAQYNTKTSASYPSQTQAQYNNNPAQGYPTQAQQYPNQAQYATQGQYASVAQT